MLTAPSHPAPPNETIASPPPLHHAAHWAAVADRTIVTQMPRIRQELALIQRAIARCGTAGVPAGYGAGRLALVRNTNDPTAASVQSQDRELMQLHRHRENLLQWTERFERVILSLPQWRDQLILRSSYGEGLRDAEIGDMMHLTRHYVNRLRHQAIQRLSDAPPANRIPE